MNITHVDFVWKAVATETPLVVKDCAKCSKRSRFVCSEKFRVNAQQRSLDVWLIYRCVACDSTWNCRLMRRVSPTSIEPDLYARLLDNDRDAARRYAFDLALLKRNGVKSEHRGEVVLAGPDLLLDAFPSDTARVLVTCELAGRWRYDRLLAPKLGLSRSRLEQLFDQGGLDLDPPVRKLGSPLQERTVVVLRIDALRKLKGLPASLERSTANEGRASGQHARPHDGTPTLHPGSPRAAVGSCASLLRGADPTSAPHASS